MSHATERLFERAAGLEAERGFALLRDRARLAAVIEVGTRGLSPELDRFALPLAEGLGDDMPRLLVTRDGHAVTCLARGMPANVPVLSWELVSGYLRKYDHAVRAGVAMSRYDSDSSLHDALHHGLRFGHRMTRDEWDAIRSLAPLLGGLLDALMETCRALLERAAAGPESMAGLPEENRRALWGGYLGGAHLLTAMGGVVRGEVHALSCLGHCDVIFKARALQLVCNNPERALEMARTALRKRKQSIAHVLVPALVILGWRFSWYRREALEVLAHLGPLAGSTAESGKVLMDALVEERHAEKCLVGYGASMFLASRPELAEASVTQSLTACIERIKRGASLEEAVRSVPPLAALFETWRPLETAFLEPRKVPPRAAQDGPMSASIALWREAQMTVLEPLNTDAFGLMAVFAAAPPEAFLPGDAPIPRWDAKHGAAYLASVLPHLVRSESEPEPPRVPVRAVARPGPNAPCTCGSGKKFKKCCGAA